MQLIIDTRTPLRHGVYLTLGEPEPEVQKPSEWVGQGSSRHTRYHTVSTGNAPRNRVVLFQAWGFNRWEVDPSLPFGALILAFDIPDKGFRHFAYPYLQFWLTHVFRVQFGPGPKFFCYGWEHQADEIAPPSSLLTKNTPISEFLAGRTNHSVRVIVALNRGGILTIQDLVDQTEDDLLEFWAIDEGSLLFIKQRLNDAGFVLKPR